MYLTKLVDISLKHSLKKARNINISKIILNNPYCHGKKHYSHYYIGSFDLYCCYLQEKYLKYRQICLGSTILK